MEEQNNMKWYWRCKNDKKSNPPLCPMHHSACLLPITYSSYRFQDYSWVLFQRESYWNRFQFLLYCYLYIVTHFLKSFLSPAVHSRFLSSLVNVSALPSSRLGKMTKTLSLKSPVSMSTFRLWLLDPQNWAEMSMYSKILPYTIWLPYISFPVHRIQHNWFPPDILLVFDTENPKQLDDQASLKV